MNDLDLEIIGHNLALLRKKHNLSQIQMASLIGYSERQYRRLEKSGTNSLSIIIKLANYFNISFTKLFSNLDEALINS